MAVESVKIAYDLTFDDYRGAARRANRGILFLMDIGAVLMFAIGILCVAVPSVGDLLGGEWLYFITGTLLASPRVTQAYQLRRTWPEVQRISGAGIIRFYEAQVVHETKLIQAQYDWSVFTGYQQTDKLMLLCLRQKHLLIIPKRCLDSSGKTEALLNIVKIKLPQK
ncbi:MAG: YcxB family protein [Tepidisphaeraceae bacterium]|jgi:hypothetical protein